MTYHVIYDGNCNLCVTLVQILEKLDQGQQFTYIPMQDSASLQSFDITPKTCELGMILIDAHNPSRRWQGSDAAEEIGRLLPAGSLFVSAYRLLPGLKWLGDQFYAWIRDNRYQLFGKRSTPYHTPYPSCCQGQKTQGEEQIINP